MKFTLARHLTIGIATLAGILLTVVLAQVLYPRVPSPSDGGASSSSVPDDPDGRDVPLAGITLPRKSLLLPLIPSFPQAFFVVQAADLRLLAQHVNTVLNDAYDPAGAHLTKAIHDFFGTDISPRYDILPMLEQETIVQVATTSSGYFFIVQGSMDDADTLETTLDRLHAGRRSQLSSAKRMERQLDDTFAIVSLQPGEIMEEEKKQGLWTVRTTSGQGKGLSTAQNGRQFAISNDAAMLQSVLTSTTGNPRPASDVWARGIMERASMESLLQSYLPTFQMEKTPFVGTGSAMQWELIRRGSETGLRLR